MPAAAAVFPIAARVSVPCASPPRTLRLKAPEVALTVLENSGAFTGAVASAAVRLAVWASAAASVRVAEAATRACEPAASAPSVEEADVFFVFFEEEGEKAPTDGVLELACRAVRSLARVDSVRGNVAWASAAALLEPVTALAAASAVALIPIERNNSFQVADAFRVVSAETTCEFSAKTVAEPETCVGSAIESVPAPCAETKSEPSPRLEPGLDARRIPALAAGSIPCPQVATDTVGAIAAAIVMEVLYAVRLPKRQSTTLERCQNGALRDSRQQILRSAVESAQAVRAACVSKLEKA